MPDKNISVRDQDISVRELHNLSQTVQFPVKEEVIYGREEKIPVLFEQIYVREEYNLLQIEKFPVKDQQIQYVKEPIPVPELYSLLQNEEFPVKDQLFSVTEEKIPVREEKIHVQELYSLLQIVQFSVRNVLFRVNNQIKHKKLVFNIKTLLLILYLVPSIVVGQQKITKGDWHGYFLLNDSTDMPFRFSVGDSNITFKNASEEIVATDVRWQGDSLFVQMPDFNSELRLKWKAFPIRPTAEYPRMKMDSLKGNFINHTRSKNNIIPVEAISMKYHPMVNEFELPDFSGRWESKFAGDEPPLDKTIGIFEQKGNHITGTFLTPTGDYRFLEGYVEGNGFWMSAFDGSHVFYFTGRRKQGLPNERIKESLEGTYYSGTHFFDTWTAFKNEKAELPNPDSLTFMKKNSGKFNFSFPDLDSNIVSLSDKKFQNKVVIVQIMGSWCPNCMDETAFMSPYYNENKGKGIEVIGLDYERIATLSAARKNIQRMKDRYKINYTLLFAGSTDKEAREKSLPQLSSIHGFPTTIVIDKKGRVRNIHTGFDGPATGERYELWKEHFQAFIDKLLAEK